MLFSIIAHNNRPCLADLVQNLRTLAPSCEVVLFNGGKDPSLADGLDIDCCPYSSPMRPKRMALYQYAVMKWLWEQQRPFDIYVALDSDMLLLKPGFEAYLNRTMRNSAYMCAWFQRINRGDDWNVGQQALSRWSKFSHLLGPQPYGCFNPGQVYRREYVERLMAFPRLEELLLRTACVRLDALEEVIYPTLAVAMGCNPINNPGSKGIYLARHSTQRLKEFVSDPDVFLLHKIGMTMDAPDRALVRAITTGEGLPAEEIDAPAAASTARVSLTRRARSAAKSLWIRFAPDYKDPPYDNRLMKAPS